MVFTSFLPIVRLFMSTLTSAVQKVSVMFSATSGSLLMYPATTATSTFNLKNFLLQFRQSCAGAITSLGNMLSFTSTMKTLFPPLPNCHTVHHRQWNLFASSWPCPAASILHTLQNGFCQRTTSSLTLPLVSNIPVCLSSHLTLHPSPPQRYSTFPILSSLPDLVNLLDPCLSILPFIPHILLLPLGPFSLQLSQSASLPSLPLFGLSLSPLLGLARVLRTKIYHIFGHSH